MIELTDAMHVAREWVVEQLRFPQRAPRTTAVIAWSHVSATTQSAVAGLSNVILDPNEIVAQPSWWRRITGRPCGYPQLTTGQRAELRQAHTSLHWPLREEGPEIRLVAVAEDVVARVVSHAAWKHPLLDGHRTVLGFTIELHLVAAAAHDLFSLRANTPAVPDNDITDNLARARAEWERRQVVAAKAEAGLIDRVAALRAYEAALTPIATSVHNLHAVTEMATGGADVDRLYEDIVGAEYSIERTSALRNDIDDIRAALESQVAYLDSLIGPHRNA
ncbi:hypothetical protein [Rhodococcus sp. JVH1]|uniref:hypothetical protein n=1 Tax=Rhodococcus sp. JVH1 TaxID=745408 RepID=UPI000271EA37|nr:hypothetical protein [Rhodococcus sp. JVH1]EJI98637.1 hypothetical protein JVH1_3893 [Rhodococcus sp. JVH1]